MFKLQKKAEELAEKGIFLGGPVHQFESVGRMQLVTLIQAGLSPDSKLLDIGCGCLRAGYWFIHFLNKECYYGIEPHEERLNSGLKYIVEAETLKEKQPKFDHNSDFDTSTFGVKFDFFLARSIWTHTSKAQIIIMLEEFLHNTNDDAVFLTSYLKASSDKDDYQGDAWVGKNHLTDTPGTVLHQFDWIEAECQKRNLEVHELPEAEKELFNNQVWLKINRKN